jgi:hypothetical protein
MRGNGGGAGTSFSFGFDGGSKQIVRNRQVTYGPTIDPYIYYALTISNMATMQKFKLTSNKLHVYIICTENIIK